MLTAEPYLSKLEFDGRDVTEGENSEVVATMVRNEGEEEVGECVLVVGQFHKLDVLANWNHIFYHIKELYLYIYTIELSEILPKCGRTVTEPALGSPVWPLLFGGIRQLLSGSSLLLPSLCWFHIHEDDFPDTTVP